MTAREFKKQVLQLFYQDMHRLEQDNYSAQRFSYDGIDRSTLFDVGKHTLFMDWFTEHYEDVFTAWSRLSDEESRNLYIDIIRYKLAGHLHVKIRSRVRELERAAEPRKGDLVASASSASLSGMFGGLVHYETQWDGVQYEADTVTDGLFFALAFQQYYFTRNSVVIAPESGDHVVDAGAFTGETAIIFSRSVGPKGCVYSFDPVENHQNICRLNFSRPGYENIMLIPYGVGDRSVDAPPIVSNDYNPGYRASSSTIPVPLRRIDDLVMDGTVHRIDFLKMDVEGSEMAALRGAESSIRYFKPKLAISIYHKPTDLSEIINYVHDLDLGYKLFVDHHTIFEEETVLYAKVT